MKVIIILIAIIIGALSSNKKMVNFNVILNTIDLLIIIILFIMVIVALGSIAFPSENLRFNSIVICFAIIFSIIMILITRSIISGGIRVIDYYIHRKKAFENGYKEVGTIIKIKKEYNTMDSSRYYLIVDLNGKKIKSIYFMDNIYTEGETIDVLTYKNRHYVVLNYMNI